MNATKNFLMLGGVMLISAPAFAQAVPAAPTPLQPQAQNASPQVPRAPEASANTQAAQPQTYVAQQPQAPAQPQVQAQAQPVQQQQQPQTLAAATPAQPALGDSGTMFARRLGIPTQGPATSAAAADDNAASVAQIAPAAGNVGKIVQPPLTAPVEAVKPIVSAPAPAAPAVQNRAPKMLGGVAMTPAKTMSDNVASSKVLTRFASYSKSAGLDGTLAGQGPYTVFAPTDRAFGKLPSKSLSDLMKPDEKTKMVRLLNNHIVPGIHDSASIKSDIKAGNGTATYVTMAGSTIRATMVRGKITLIDENGNRSAVTTADAYQSNGVLHALDTVLIPK